MQQLVLPATDAHTPDVRNSTREKRIKQPNTHTHLRPEGEKGEAVFAARRHPKLPLQHKTRVRGDGALRVEHRPVEATRQLARRQRLLQRRKARIPRQLRA
eukprot:3933306-Rhodomonas_salina.2